MSFKVTITGDIDTVQFFKMLSSNIEPMVTIPATRSWATALRDAMIKREHFRSGKMRSMTKITPMGKYWQVIVDVGYADIENSRKGNKRGKKGGGQGTPHRFVEPSIMEVEKPQMTNLLMLLDKLISS